MNVFLYLQKCIIPPDFSILTLMTKFVKFGQVDDDDDGGQAQIRLPNISIPSYQLVHPTLHKRTTLKAKLDLRSFD